MSYKLYPIHEADGNLRGFEFVSYGPKGMIDKVIDFAPAEKRADIQPCACDIAYFLMMRKSD